jgi:signal transduction histidine kinase
MMRMARYLVVALLFFVASLGLTLLCAATLFGVPRADLPGVAWLLVGAGGGAGLAALLLLRPTVLGRLGGIRAHLVGAGLVGSLLLLGMVLAGSRAMFISAHDSSILFTMLLFASLLAVGFSLYGATPLANRVENLRRGAARGDLDAEVPVEGSDEVAALAADFNLMAKRLAEAAAREREAEGARRDLVAAVSHDLRTPLASAQALVEAVADGVAEDAAVRDRYIATARGELEKLGRLVDDLFELSRIDSGALKLELEEVSLRDLVSDTISGFGGQAERGGVRLVGEVPASADAVLASPTRLERVLYNLVSNALRHTPPEGTVALRAEPVGERVHVEVSDTGEGIAREDLPRVFERSFRGERSRTRDGAGLGLAIARGLIEAHGSEIQAESEPGQGSRFHFTLARSG